MENRKQLFIILAVANFFLYFGFNIWQAVFNNSRFAHLLTGFEKWGNLSAWPKNLP